MIADAPELIRDVAALFVDRKGDYPKHVAEWWDEKRDAKTYDLELPVVAHPPCQRWCRLAGLVDARWGHKRGDDGGTFASALATVRRVGGVLEHPAYSDAWKAYGLPHPPTGGGWVVGAEDFEWTCYVEQWRYGHRAKKATWLYYCGLTEPPALRWGHIHDSKAMATWDAGRVRSKAQRSEGLAWVSWCGNKTRNGGEQRPRLTHKEAIHTPAEFRDALIALARHSQMEPSA